MSLPRKREMAICGAQKSYIITLPIGRQKFTIILFSDETHGIVECKNHDYNPIFTIEDYLYKMSKSVEATLYMESSFSNQWSKQKKSHIENLYLKFKNKTNKFTVKHIDERFINTDINILIKRLLESTGKKGIQKLFDIMIMKDFEEYKKMIDFSLTYLIKKYKLKSYKILLNKILKVCFDELVYFYIENERILIKEQQQFENGEFKVLGDEHVIYEFMSSFFMFMVDLTFFVDFNPSTKYHFAFLGSQHIMNIVKVYKLLKKPCIEIKSFGNCLPVSKINKIVGI